MSAKFHVVAAPGGFHVCRQMLDGQLLSVLECPTRETADAEAELLGAIANAAPCAYFAGRKVPVGHLSTHPAQRRAVRWFSDAEAV